MSKCANVQIVIAELKILFAHLHIYSFAHQLMWLEVSKNSKHTRTALRLDGSKSISNRALIMLALAGVEPGEFLRGLSTSRDTQTQLKLLRQTSNQYDAGDAGTVFRFMTAFLTLKEGVQELTGSKRMKERPIGPLVDALRLLGADIRYMEKEGYPPLLIGDKKPSGGLLKIPAGISSQFLSALLMIGPYLEGGLIVEPEGHMVSRPYLEMTIRLMEFFGARVSWLGKQIRVEASPYIPKTLQVEADWSAASYWYIIAGLSDSADIVLEGLGDQGIQGDSVIADLCRPLGIHTQFESGGIRITKATGAVVDAPNKMNFRSCPDIAQSMAVLYAGMGLSAEFEGLETLSLKETDRIAALKKELGKLGVQFDCLNEEEEPRERVYKIEGKAGFNSVIIGTYEDHRMAMAFAPLGLMGRILIENPKVVDKSYPKFWEHLEQAGFELNAV